MTDHRLKTYLLRQHRWISQYLIYDIVHIQNTTMPVYGKYWFVLMEAIFIRKYVNTRYKKDIEMEAADFEHECLWIWQHT